MIFSNKYDFTSRVAQRRGFCFDERDGDAIDKSSVLRQELREMQQTRLSPDLGELALRDFIQAKPHVNSE